MPTFTHDVSEDGLSLITTYDDPERDIDGRIVPKVADYGRSRSACRKGQSRHERRLIKLAERAQNTSTGVTCKRVGPFIIGYGTSYGEHDTWAFRIGKFTLRPSGVTHKQDGRFFVGIGGKRRSYFISIERYSPPVKPIKPRITRADISVPIKNPFQAGDMVTVPAGAIVWDKEMRNSQTINRKRRVKVGRTGDGHFSVEKLSADLYGSNLVGTILAHKPYVVWGEKEFRTEVTPELLEANGQTVEYAETEYADFSAYIESGRYELEGMGL